MEDKQKAKLVCLINDGTFEDPDLKSIPQPFIIGNLISETEKEIQLEFEFNGKIYSKKAKKQVAKKLFQDPKEINTAELNRLNEINFLECLINITNRLGTQKYFNFVDEGLLLLYDNYKQAEFEGFKFSQMNLKVNFILHSLLSTKRISQW